MGFSTINVALRINAIGVRSGKLTLWNCDRGQVWQTDIVELFWYSINFKFRIAESARDAVAASRVIRSSPMIPVNNDCKKSPSAAVTKLEAACQT